METLQEFLRPLLEQRAHRSLLFEFASLALQAPLESEVVARVSANLKPNKVILPRWDRETLEALPASVTYSLEIDETSAVFVLEEKDVEVLTRFTNLTKLHLTNTKFKQVRHTHTLRQMDWFLYSSVQELTNTSVTSCETLFEKRRLCHCSEQRSRH